MTAVVVVVIALGTALASSSANLRAEHSLARDVDRTARLWIPLMQRLRIAAPLTHAVAMSGNAVFAADVRVAMSNAETFAAQQQEKSDQEAARVAADASKLCARPVESDGSCVADIILGDMPGVPGPTVRHLYVMPGDKVISGFMLSRHTVWEAGDVMDVIQRLGQAESGFVLDVGANIGTYAIPIAVWQKLVGGERGVIAVEARRESAELLTRSAALNSVQLELVHGAMVQHRDHFPAGVCTSAGSMNFSTEMNIGGSQTEQGRRKFSTCHEYSPAYTLDALLSASSHMKKVVAAKFDCEGCEGQALFGGATFLTNYAPCFLQVEVTEKYLCESGTLWPDVKAYVQRMGYVYMGADNKYKEQGRHDECKSYLTGPEFQATTWWVQENLPQCLSKFDSKYVI